MIRRRSRSYSSFVIVPLAYASRRLASSLPTLVLLRGAEDHQLQAGSRPINPAVSTIETVDTSEARRRVGWRGADDIMLDERVENWKCAARIAER